MPISEDDTVYTIIAQNDGTFGVEVFSPKALPNIVSGFQTEVEAQEWVANALNHTAITGHHPVPGQTALM